MPHAPEATARGDGATVEDTRTEAPPLSPADPSPTHRLTLDDLLDVRTLAPMRSVALSPDGRLLAYATQRSGDLCHRRDGPINGVPSIWERCRLAVLDIDQGGTVPLVPDAFAAWSPAWSPRGDLLAFLAAARPEGPVELWAWAPSAGRARCVTPRPVHPHGVPRWCPDGRRMCVPLVPPDGGVPESPGTPGVAVLESPPPGEPGAPRGPWAWADLFAVDMHTGEEQTLVEGLRAVEGFPAPTGGHLLWAEAGVQPDPARYVFRHTLHLVRSGDGRRGPVCTVETGVNWEHSEPRWSPDGRRFCIAVGGAVTVWEVEHAYEQQPQGLNLPDGRRPGGWLAWTADGAGILVWADRALWLCRPDTGTVTRVGAPGITGAVQRADRDHLPPGDLLAVAGRQLHRIPWDPDEPAETLIEQPDLIVGFRRRDRMYALGDATPDARRLVYCLRDDLFMADDTGRRHRRLTDHNPHMRGISRGTWHGFAFRTAHGREVGAALLTPPGWDHGTPCPTVVGFYPGGWPSRDPAAASLSIDAELLAARGHAVLLPDVPYDHRAPGDPSDAAPAAVLAAVNEAVRLGYADPDRLAVMGCSYGGMAVLSLLTRTGRFRAAVAEAGIADLAAKYGQMHLALDHPEWIGSVPWSETGQGGMGGPPWERPLRYVANSPVYALDRITTPLLLVAGSYDTAVSWAQSGEVFVGLRRLGRTCTLLVGRGEGHGISRWSEPNRREAVVRVLEWLDRHLKAD